MSKMSGFKAFLAAVFVDVIGWMIMIAPWVVVFGTGSYQEIATWVVYGAYGGITLYGLFYFIGSIRCVDAVAYVIIKDLRNNSQWFTYIPVISVVTCSIVAGYHSMYELAAILITPPTIVYISRIILKAKAKKVTNDT